MLIDVNSIGYHIERKIKRLYNKRIDIILIIIFIVLLITKVFTILIPILISYFDGLCFFEAGRLAFSNLSRSTIFVMDNLDKTTCGSNFSM